MESDLHQIPPRAYTLKPYKAAINTIMLAHLSDTRLNPSLIFVYKAHFSKAGLTAY